MDRDSFVARHTSDWDRLSRLSLLRRPTPAESDELVRLYLRASSHLSTARREYADPTLLLHLNRLVASANARIYGTRARTLAGVRRAITQTFPAAVWHLRRPILVSTAVFLTGFVLATMWIANSPAALDIALPPEVRDAYLESTFEDYYSSQPAGQFAAQVFTNNARVGIFAFAAGIVLALPTLVILGYNALHVGVAAGAFHSVGRAGHFYGLILPHGLLELTAVFIAGGTGLALGWAIISPGGQRRSRALMEQARRAIVVVLGLVVVFFIAGLIEAFVTPSSLPTWARVGTGMAVEATFLGYIVVYGRAAADQGRTGAAGEGRHNTFRDLRSR